MLKEDFMWALYFRHDCELFDDKRKIPKVDLEFILDAGRLSFSKEANRCRFVVIVNPEIKRSLVGLCKQGRQIDSSSAIIAILVKASEPCPQHHIAVANMMTAAAAIGIDSCPMTGFDVDSTRDALGVRDYEVATILPLGYRMHPQPEKRYQPLSDLVEYR